MLAALTMITRGLKGVKSFTITSLEHSQHETPMAHAQNSRDVRAVGDQRPTSASQARLKQHIHSRAAAAALTERDPCGLSSTWKSNLKASTSRSVASRLAKYARRDSWLRAWRIVVVGTRVGCRPVLLLAAAGPATKVGEAWASGAGDDSEVPLPSPADAAAGGAPGLRGARTRSH